MAFRRRGRRRNVVWLPNLKRVIDTQAGDIPTNLLIGTIPVDSRADFTTLTFPLVRDENPEQDTDNTLADYTQGGYILKRVVGKLFVGMRQQLNEPGPDVACGIVTAALEVLRTSPDDNNPISATTSNYNPLAEGNERDPWIWQRSWILANGNANPAGLTGALETWGLAPFLNVEYGSVMDGPHVDVKVGRRIGTEERLFLSMTTNSIEEWVEGTVDGDVDFIFQYRVLGIPVRSSNRKNTSR